MCRGVYIHLYVLTICSLNTEEQETAWYRSCKSMHVLNVVPLTRCQRAHAHHMGAPR